MTYFWDVALSKERSVKKVSIYYILRDCKRSEEDENEGTLGALSIINAYPMRLYQSFFK